MYLLAGQFRLSDRGLAKLCARYGIPVPPRGYWNKLKAGRPPPTFELPQPDRNQPIAELRAYDAAGCQLTEADMPEEWVIPGMLKRVFPGFLTPATAGAETQAAAPRQSKDGSFGELALPTGKNCPIKKAQLDGCA